MSSVARESAIPRSEAKGSLHKATSSSCSEPMSSTCSDLVSHSGCRRQKFLDFRHSGYLHTNTCPFARRVDECKLRARGAAAALRHALPNEAYKYEIDSTCSDYCRTCVTLHPRSCQLQSSSSCHPNSVIIDSCLSSPKTAFTVDYV